MISEDPNTEPIVPMGKNDFKVGMHPWDGQRTMG